MQPTLEPLLTRGDRPVGVKGCVIGFVEISWHGLIIAGFHVNTGPRGLFVEFRAIERQVAAGYGLLVSDGPRARGVQDRGVSGADEALSAGCFRVRG